MTYEETLDYLYNSAPLFQHIGKDAYKEGLENTYLLDEYFEHPHRKFHTIHLLSSKIMESHSGGKLKERGVQRFEEGTVLFNEVNYELLRNRSSVDADSFTKIN